MSEKENAPILPMLNLTDESDAVILGQPPVSITIDSVTFSGTSEVRLDLLPRPSIYVYCTFENIDQSPPIQKVLSHPEAVQSLDLDGSEMEGFVTKSNWLLGLPGQLELTWCPRLDTMQALGDDSTQMHAVIFHLFNLDFRGAPRSTQQIGSSSHVIEHIDLASADWKVNIRSLVSTRNDQNALREKGGYRLTHVGKVSLADNSYFSGKDANSILEALRLFLCFANGGPCNPICPFGLDTSGSQVWSQWSSPIEWDRVPMSWSGRQNPEFLSDLFPIFISKWSIDNWREALSDAIWWYLGANHSSRGIDSCIVSAQTAIERLSYEYSVCDKQLITSQGFNRLQASDQYRLLLSSLGIPLEIPSTATALTTAAQQTNKNWSDAPHALTQIRNDFVHGGKTRTTLPDQCYVEAWMLTVWILELAILALCDYQGKHWNRNNGQTEVVPWADHS